MRICVKRGLGTTYTTEINEVLISSIPVALIRGEQELNAGSGLIAVTLETVYRPTAKVGDLIEVADELLGSSWRGICTSVEHALGENLQLVTKLGIQRG